MDYAMGTSKASFNPPARVCTRTIRERGVTLISAGLDEVPMAYKNIREVMAAQSDLVTVLGQFDPKLVKMAPSGERPED
jgi:tRNA-splicing ligase RtcB